jgi:alpha-ketoglutarate-dependent taurine dioxygenase
MENRIPAPPSIPIRRPARRAVAGPEQSWVHETTLPSGDGFPLVLEPAFAEIDLSGWARDHRDFLQSRLLRHGALLLRGFAVEGVEEFEAFVAAASDGALMEYEDRTSPRSHVSGNVFTSTDYPDAETIFLHNENSYSQRWPLKILFFCVTPALEGGATPIADCRKVLQRIPEAVRDRFEARQVMYVRNFGDGVGLPWQEVFGTSDPAAVEEYCRRARIEAEWKPGNRLRTRQVRPAVARHPRTGESVWFNQVPLFHVGMLDPEVRRELLAAFGEEGLPTHACYGDGSPIEASDLEAVRRAYDEETRSFPWRRGDILLLDNVLTAHGRAPFKGPRKVVVGMGEPFGWDALEAGRAR